MQDHENYELTSQGESELRAGVTALSAAEIELMVRIDKGLSIAQIRSSVPSLSVAAFNSTFQALLERRLLAVVVVDPFTMDIQAQLTSLALSASDVNVNSNANAEVVALSLKRSGYHVSIAHQPAPSDKRTSDDLLYVLVVEDEPMLAKFIQGYLSLEGFIVRLASNRAEIILELSKSSIPDLILLDVMLPDADGFDILLRVRLHPVLKFVPVIMLTGKTSREAVIKGLASGANGYVTKPFEADVLMRAIRTVLGLPETPVVSQNQKDPWSALR